MTAPGWCQPRGYRAGEGLEPSVGDVVVGRVGPLPALSDFGQLQIGRIEVNGRHTQVFETCSWCGVRTADAGQDGALRLGMPRCELLDE